MGSWFKSFKHNVQTMGHKLQHAGHTFGKAVKSEWKHVQSNVKDIGKFIQKDVFHSKFVKGLEDNIVADTNVPKVLDSAEAPLIAGIGGAGVALAVVGAVAGFALFA